MKKKIILGVILLLVGIGCMIAGVCLFSSLPDVQYTNDFTIKEELRMFGGIVTTLLGAVGVFGGIISLWSILD